MQFSVNTAFFVLDFTLWLSLNNHRSQVLELQLQRGDHKDIMDRNDGAFSRLEEENLFAKISGK